MEVAEAVPYLAPASWYAVWLASLLEGKTDTQARQEANRKTGFAERRGSRQWARATIGENMTLSVPIKGGTSAAKRLPPGEALVSGHGDWPRQHLGALEGLLGRTPCHHLLVAELATVIRQAEGAPLADMTERIHCLLLEKLGFPSVLQTLKQLTEQERLRLGKRARELRVSLSPDRTLWEWVAAKGKEALIPLL